MSSAAATVKAFQPITLQGQLDTGHAVTLVNAYNHGRDGYYLDLHTTKRTTPCWATAT